MNGVSSMMLGARVAHYLTLAAFIPAGREIIYSLMAGAILFVLSALAGVCVCFQRVEVLIGARVILGVANGGMPPYAAPLSLKWRRVKESIPRQNIDR